MLFASIAVLIPVQAQAAHHSSVSNTRLTLDEAKAIVDEYQKAEYNSLEEMFQDDMSKGYLDYVKSTDNAYGIYVNRYTGVLYYRNETTGEMLSSNSYNFKGAGNVAELTSQVSVSYTTISSEVPEVYLSSTWAAKYNQITVSQIDGGLRISYAIGDTATRCLLPVMIEAHEFEDDILKPMFNALNELMTENLGARYALDYFGSSKYYNEETIYGNGNDKGGERFLHTTSIRKFSTDFDNKIYDFEQDYIALNGSIPLEVTLKVNAVEELMTAINTVFNAYQPYNPSHKDFSYDKNNTPEICLDGYAVYKVKNTDYSQMAAKAKYVKAYCPNYTFEMMYEDEAFCNYEHKYESKPVFRCSLEYTFNEDNSLSVRLPSNSIVFDETEYILRSITPLQYFGAADFRNDGYIFLPDGSGSIIQFEDFRNSNIAMSSSLSIYGNDYCYSEITGAHKQPLTMPVYGIASSKQVGGSVQSLGYFAILEEGASMASMNVRYMSKTFKEGAVYTTFTPYPSDKFDISDTISVGGSSFYSIVSESKYTGSYVTRYVMLSGNNANYMGMAEYYRDYLVKNGTLTAMENVSDDLPLYLEALGSIEVVEKFLTFPVNVSKAITTFEDIETIYEELGQAKQKMLDKAAEYDALAFAESDNNELKKDYEEIAANYRRLAAKVVDIDNINFKLTGFANGGLYYTYPAKVKWERSLGGKSDFKDLLETAADRTDADSNFGIYPDFDFQYINNTALFDNVGKRGTVSRMVDNRYASKQVYNSVLGEFETVYAMIVSADALDELYDKFIDKYEKYDVTGISVSTLGSDLNSNFDEDNPVSRDEAQGYVTDLLDRIANESNYSVMISQGNIYAVKYADHILDVCTDSSYYRYSSYTIPFVGMILHGYVNYAGKALNYSGSPDYDLLRSIENGASIYYVIGYQNTDLMKDDEKLNKYYSVSYENWYDDIVEKYATINEVLGDIQNFKIIDHKVLIGERIIDEDEQLANLNALKNEFVAQFTAKLQSEIDAKLEELRNDPSGNDYNKRVGVSADIDALVAIAVEMFELDSEADLDPDYDPNAEKPKATFRQTLIAALAQFEREYDVTNVDPSNVVTASVNTLDYDSEYKYVTGSFATDGKSYVSTDYTVANDLIVMVTYGDGNGKTRTFVINYNIYGVKVLLENGREIKLDKYSFDYYDNF